ncbi:MAG: PKD domain-containing protein, partial [Candidatus Brockarchaeota archaeon]|nr:PKD domain-containing protein [Candidatus Brockarchaeota archaeon]
MQLAKRRIALLALFVALLANISACSSDLNSEKSNFLVLINQYRQENGVAPLKVSSALTTAAQRHSEDMAAHNYFSHESLDGRTPIDRMRAAGYTYDTAWGENIAAGYYWRGGSYSYTAEDVFENWRNSPGHNANMLNPNYVVIGIGLAFNDSSTYKYYWTTDFGGYDDSGTSPPPNSPPNVPATPSGPSEGFPGTSYSFSTSSTDPEGDQVKYTFDWGDGTTAATGFLPSGSTGTLSHSWSRSGQYNVRAKATDANGASSGWSTPFTITIQNRPPNAPSAPSGPAAGFTSTSYSFATSATDPDGNQLKYTFDWGDGTTSTTGFLASGSTASASHSWSEAGNYDVKVKATDSEGAESGWSPAALIEIENAPPIIQGAPAGTTSCLPNSSYEFTVCAYDPDGGGVRCIFDWGDGTTTETGMENSGSSFTASHAWGRIGTFNVKAKAIDSAGKESAWSQPTVVSVKFPSAITISVSATTIARGERLTVKGTISPPQESTVTIAYRKPDGSQLTVQVMSDQEGDFHDIIAPNVVGTWTVRASWGGDESHFGSSTEQISFKVDPALCSLTFESNATGLSLIVDGVNYSMPQSFRWLEGTVHSVVVEQAHAFSEGGRYVFKSWSDGCSERSRNIVVKDPGVYLAIYSTQYLVSTRVAPDSTLNESWYELGSTVRLSVNCTTIQQGKYSRLVFAGWSNNASGDSIEISVDGPVTVEARWKTQFLFQVSSPYGEAGGGGWYGAGSEVALSLYPSILDCGNGTRRVFDSWVGEGDGCYSGSEPNATIFASGPVNESARWRT